MGTEVGAKLGRKIEPRQAKTGQDRPRQGKGREAKGREGKRKGRGRQGLKGIKCPPGGGRGSPDP